MSLSSRSARRVAITGLGLISPLGNNPETLWNALLARRSGVAPVASLPPGSLPVSFAAEAREFSGRIEDFGELEGEQKKQIRKGLKVMCRECLMGVAASQLALADSRLAASQRDPQRSGIIFGSDYMVSAPDEFAAPIEACLDERREFHFSRWSPDGMSKMNPLWLLKYLPNMPASHVAIYNDLRGPNNSLTHREASGNLAIGEAFRIIVRGHADVMLAGATGSRVHPMKAIHAKLLEDLAVGDSPERASRPFDRDRSGMVLGEGAGVIVLEEWEHAQARGATIYGEVAGAASSAVVDRRQAPRRDAALANAMRAALREAGLTPDKVGHVHAHGLGTRQCDIEESRALAEVFGQHAAHVPVSAAKSYFGNLGAASGVVELIASTLALGRGKLFPVLNYDTPDPECPVAAVTGDGANPGDSFLSLSTTPQAQASCVLVRRFA